MAAATAGVFFVLLGSASASAATTIPVQRIYGQDAIDTSIAVSQAEFPSSGSAGAVVLARSDFFSDALAGGPLAASAGGPLLITPGAGQSSSLDPRVQAEIQRVLPSGHTIYILGGDLALSPNIDSTLTGLGYTVVREAGTDEYATAVDVAEQLGNPSTIFEATGLNFADALSAVPAAIDKGGAILLTDGATQASETGTYLAAHASDSRYAIGGPLAAYGADSGANPVYGQDLYGTSAAVASTFFASTTTFGAATGTTFPDALSGGVFMGSPKGPVLLVEPSGPLPPAIAGYLHDVSSTLTQGYVFGGPLAVGEDVRAELSSPQAPLAVVTPSLPAATWGHGYSATLSASGGTAPYAWTTTSGALPPGLTLSSNGDITGSPTSTGSYSFTVQVTDSSAQTASAPLSIMVPPQPSVNWSGYVITGGPYTAVTGTFTVPYLENGATSSDGFAEWVGIDGFGSSSLIQAGVAEQVDPSNPGEFTVQPWWEILPAPETPIYTVTVAPGDQVTVSIVEMSGSTWQIQLTDNTNSENFTTDQTYSGPQSSAEWIVEAPSGPYSVDQLAPYGPEVTFSALQFTGAQDNMVEDVLVQNGYQVSTPSAIDSNGFNVVYGSTAPAAP